MRTRTPESERMDRKLVLLVLSLPILAVTLIASIGTSAPPPGKGGGGGTGVNYTIFTLYTDNDTLRGNAFAINENDQIVGDVSEVGGSDRFPALWTVMREKRSTDSVLTVLPGGVGAAYGVNELGEIVGAGPYTGRYWASSSSQEGPNQNLPSIPDRLRLYY